MRGNGLPESFSHDVLIKSGGVSPASRGVDPASRSVDHASRGIHAASISPGGACSWSRLCKAGCSLQETFSKLVYYVLQELFGQQTESAAQICSCIHTQAICRPAIQVMQLDQKAVVKLQP